MNILGISAGFHDAGVSVVDRHGDILFAAHSERYSKRKHDANLDPALIKEAMRYGKINHIAYYEIPWKKQLRRWRSGEGIQWGNLLLEQCLEEQLGPYIKQIQENYIIDPWHHLSGVHTTAHGHHLSHAAAGFQTSPFDRATVVIIDAIGEWDTITIWGAEYNHMGVARYQRLWRQQYPHSIGLFYSAMTRRIGLHPMDEEYITMGMAAWGRNVWYQDMREHVIANERDLRLQHNFHTGMSSDFLEHSSNENIAAEIGRAHV